MRSSKTRDRPFGHGWTEAADKQKLETNYDDQMYENCHISSSKPLDISKLVERAIIWLEIVTKGYDELCHEISRNLLPLETDSVDIIFQHTLRHGSL